MTPSQVEMDALERTVLQAVFGKEYEKSQIFKMAETFFPGRIQGCIDRFEELLSPFMQEDGSTDGARLKRVLALKYPNWAHIVPDREFRLAELADMVADFTRRRI